TGDRSAGRACRARPSSGRATCRTAPRDRTRARAGRARPGRTFAPSRGTAGARRCHRDRRPWPGPYRPIRPAASATAFVPGAATPGSESDSSPTVRWGGRGAGGSSPVRGAAPEVVVALVAVEGRDPVERPTAQSKVSEEAVPVEQRRAVEADGIARQRRRGPLTEE